MKDFPKRTDYCGNLGAGDDGRRVLLYGWVHRVRGAGGVTFVQLRDISGIVQTVFDRSVDADLQERASSLGHEWVVRLTGSVRKRPEKDINKDMDTGEIEVLAGGLEVLAQSEVLPFQVVEKAGRAGDALRLRHRYLDLRRPEVAGWFITRSKLTGIIHSYMQENDFIHVETPELCKSTPEGARDFLVPSRREPGSFYALPQSPQLYKQLLMIAGFDRYYQLARCFRDEDFRADRSVEFTQLDIETSFMAPEHIFTIIEGLFARIADALPGTGLPKLESFERITWHDAMRRYGSDKPDLRFGLEILDVGAVLGEDGPTGFRAIDDNLDSDGFVGGILVRGGAGSYSRKKLDQLSDTARKAGGKGVLVVKWSEDGSLSSPLVKAAGEERVRRVMKKFDAGPGDLLVMAAGRWEKTCAVLGSLRLDLAAREKLIPDKGYAIAWITDFPWLERDGESGRWVPRHHPFTKPDMDDLSRYIDSDPGRIKAQAYDLVMNGYELGGGSVRIHDAGLQHKMFELLAIPPGEAQSKFGFLLDALCYGAPPHAGIALGIDRMAAILAGRDSIRDVIAFPKTGQGRCPLTGAPTNASPGQLKELGLDVVHE